MADFSRSRHVASALLQLSLNATKHTLDSGSRIRWRWIHLSDQRLACVGAPACRSLILLNTHSSISPRSAFTSSVSPTKLVSSSSSPVSLHPACPFLPPVSLCHHSSSHLHSSSPAEEMEGVGVDLWLQVRVQPVPPGLAQLCTQVLEDLISTCVASFSPRFDFKAGLRFLFAPLHVSGLLKENVSEAFKSCSLTNKVLDDPCCLV